MPYVVTFEPTPGRRCKRIVNRHFACRHDEITRELAMAAGIPLIQVVGHRYYSTMDEATADFQDQSSDR